MHHGIDLITMVIILGTFQGFFLALIILRNKHGNRRANTALALLLLCFSISIINIPLIRLRMYNHGFYILNLPMNLMFLFGPLFYIYVRLLSSSNYGLKLKHLWHLAPFVLTFFYFLKFYLNNTNYKVHYINSIFFMNRQLSNYVVLVILICAQIHMWIYILSLWRLLNQHQSNVKQIYSTIDKVSLDWIRFFLSMFTIVYLLFFGLSFFLISGDRYLMYGILGIIVTVSILVLGYKGLKQPEILFVLEPAKPALQKELSGKGQVYLNQLNDILTQKKLYTNPDLTLMDLAMSLSISRSTLSQVINEIAGMNFFDFINQYRVEAVKQMLLSPEHDHLTFISLAAEAGFNSKSSFYRIFKKTTGMTPTEFKFHHASDSLISKSI